MNKPLELRIKINATVYVAVSAILFGVWPFLATRLTNADFSISNMLFWRFLIAVIWLLFCQVFTAKAVIRKVNYRTAILMFLLGAVCYGGTSGIYFVAAQFIGTGLAMVIFFSYPLLVAVCLWLKNRHIINRFLIFALIMMSIGLFMLKGGSIEHISLIGVFYAVLAAVSYTVFMLFNQRIKARLDMKISTILICLGCATFYFIMTVYNRQLTIPHTMHAWSYILALGILLTAVPVQLLLKGMQHMNPLYVSVLSVLEPLVTMWLGIAILNEHVSVSQLIGCVIILVSALLIQFQHMRK